MPAAEWKINQEFFLLLAELLMGSILSDTTSTAETKDRWDSLQAVLEERSALCKLSLCLCIACETSKVTKELPSSIPVENGKICLKGYVPDEALDLPRLQSNAEFRLPEFDQAEADLAALRCHCRESGFQDLLDDLSLAQDALGWVIDKLRAR